MKDISLKEMLSEAVHFGHKTQKWNPKMKPYLYGKRSGIHLFDLQQSATKFKEALEFLHKSVVDGKKILFVSTKQHTTPLLNEIHQETKMPIVTHRWVGGMLTNFSTMKERIRKYKKLLKEEESGALERFKKKEQVKIKKEIKKLGDTFNGVADMFSVPEILFVIDGNRDNTAIKEGRLLNMKIVGLCDSNVDPDKYDYPIPANDDALKSVTYFLNFVKAVILDAQKQKPKKEEKVVKIKQNTK